MRHLSEVSRPSGDIIGWSPAHPESGLSRVYLTRHLPPSSFLSSSTVCASADSPALFHAGAAHGVSRTRPSSIRRGWRRKMERPGRPRAQWQRCRSSTAMPGDQRWSVDLKPHLRLEPVATPRKRGTQAGTLAHEVPGRPDPSRRKQPGEQRRRSVRPVRRPRLECSAEARSRFGSTRRARDRSRSRRVDAHLPGGSAVPDRPEATGPSQHPDDRRDARQGTLQGNTEMNPRFRPGTSASTSP
jgi:hypothetical protein